jgi:hydroxymethylpyrimidine/phosphomethylpyrimidine kinase
MTTALAIAGSDSGGGAGLQADLKTFAAHRVFGLSAVTAVTAQNSAKIESVYPVPATVVVAQIESVVSDFEVHAVKTGMLVNVSIVEAVAATIETLKLPYLVVDPVILATSGERLLSKDAIAKVKTELFKSAHVVTPNRPEAELLTGYSINSISEAHDAAYRIHDLGPEAVILKGGHLPGDDVVDILFDGHDFVEFRKPRINTIHTHGSGCTFGAAVASGLALGQPLTEATQDATSYVEQAIRHASSTGHNHSPLEHFWQK